MGSDTDSDSGHAMSAPMDKLLDDDSALDMLEQLDREEEAIESRDDKESPWMTERLVPSQPFTPAKAMQFGAVSQNNARFAWHE
jgi:hypothetical protein